MSSSEIVRHGRVRRAFIGVAGQTVPLPRRLVVALGRKQARGVAIVSLEPDSPAAKAGLQAGNIVLALDGEPVTGADDLVRLLCGARIGVATSLTVIAGSELRQIVVLPAERTTRNGQMKPIAVVTTVANREDAHRLARTLVERKLAACAQISEIESIHHWKGAVQQKPSCACRSRRPTSVTSWSRAPSASCIPTSRRRSTPSPSSTSMRPMPSGSRRMPAVGMLGARPSGPLMNS